MNFVEEYRNWWNKSINGRFPGFHSEKRRWKREKFPRGPESHWKNLVSMTRNRQKKKGNKRRKKEQHPTKRRKKVIETLKRIGKKVMKCVCGIRMWSIFGRRRNVALLTPPWEPIFSLSPLLSLSLLLWRSFQFPSHIIFLLLLFTSFALQLLVAPRSQSELIDIDRYLSIFSPIDNFPICLAGPMDNGADSIGECVCVRRVGRRD